MRLKLALVRMTNLQQLDLCLQYIQWRRRFVPARAELFCNENFGLGDQDGSFSA